ncbi:MAG: c-type cytochrome [Acidobacteria bacterium]|nr:c-type cytochrome [Acidobacteriota bacterium]
MRVRVLVPCVVVATVFAGAACEQGPLPTQKEGRMLYAENGCASCHGPAGRGDGPVGQTLDPRPRDFQDVAAFKRGFDVEAIARTLATGILVPAAPARGATGAPSHHQQGMPKFDHLSEVERQSLALYVISLHDPARQGARQP